MKTKIGTQIVSNNTKAMNALHNEMKAIAKQFESLKKIEEIDAGPYSFGPAYNFTLLLNRAKDIQIQLALLQDEINIAIKIENYLEE